MFSTPGSELADHCPVTSNWVELAAHAFSD
jgi:hypothetical protein